jgi:hypothetical protein
MKLFVLTSILFLAATLVVMGQPRLPGSRDEGTIPAAAKKNTAVDTLLQSNIFTWTLTEEYSRKKEALLDTLTLGFHLYEPIYKLSISNTHLGKNGSPYQSNLFFNRPDDNGFYFTRHLKAYAPLASETPYYNTTLSFSTLTYVQDLSAMGGPEQAFDAFMIRNIDPYTNMGFRFHVNVTEPEYKLLESNHRHFNFFVSRNSERYNGYFSVVNGSNELVENGGIVEENVNPFSNPFNLIVKFIGINGLTNNNTAFSAFTSHEYRLGKKIPELDEDSVVHIRFEPKLSIQYSAELENHQRKMTESFVDTSMFDNTYIRMGNNQIDSIRFTRFSHSIQLKGLESSTRKYSFGTKAFLRNEIVLATHPVPFGVREYRYANLDAGASIYRQEGNLWKWSATGQIVVLGRNLGDAQIRGKIETRLPLKKDTLLLEAEGWYRDQSANLFQEHLLTNHFKWENQFRKQHDVVLKGKIEIPVLKAGAGANYALLSNYLYNNQQQVPDQYEKEFSVFSIWLIKDFSFWRFGWENQVVWQQTSDKTVLRLPALSAYSTLYYSHYLFKVMQIQLGAELYYNTPFYADGYNPATTQFHIQDKSKIGGFPVVNAYVNAKLKRTSAFIKMSHANSMINGTNFFSAPDYPLGQMVVRFGFLWSFYD